MHPSTPFNTINPPFVTPYPVRPLCREASARAPSLATRPGKTTVAWRGDRMISDVKKRDAMRITKFVIKLTWWLIPLSKWVITPVISGLTQISLNMYGLIHVIDIWKHIFK